MSSEPKIRITPDGVAPADPSAPEPITVEVARRIPVDGVLVDRTDVFELQPDAALNLLGVFREIYFHHDPTFGFRNFECGRGICSTCNVMYEGRVQKGCRIPVEPGSHISIAAQQPDRALRDIACRIGGGEDADEDT